MNSMYFLTFAATTFISIFTPLLLAADRCQEIQEYRAQILKETEAYTKHDQVRLCMNTHVNAAMKKNLDDVEVIERTFRYSNMRIENLEDLKNIFKPGSLYAENEKKIRADIQKIPEADRSSSMARFLLNGPIEEFKKACRGINLDERSEPISNAFTELEELMRKYPHMSIDMILTRVARGTDTEISLNWDRRMLTPFVAKTMLFEFLRAKSTGEKPIGFMNLIRDLQLKATYKDIKQDGSVSPLDLYSVSIHNGYIFGSYQKWIEAFKEKNPPIQGMDCTTMIQSCVHSLNQNRDEKPNKNETSEPQMRSEPKVPRLNTVHLFQMIDDRLAEVPEEVQKYFNERYLWKKVEREEDMKPGDFIFVRGHMFLHGGYSKDRKTGKLEPITFEATGNEKRTIGVFHRSFYEPGSDCQKLRLNQSGKDIFVLQIRPEKKAASIKQATPRQ